MWLVRVRVRLVGFTNEWVESLKNGGGWDMMMFLVVSQ